MNTNKDVVEQLKKIVKEMGSQTVLAEKIGISRPYLNDVLKGKRDPGPAILQYLRLVKVVTYEQESEAQ